MNDGGITALTLNSYLLVSASLFIISIVGISLK